MHDNTVDEDFAIDTQPAQSNRLIVCRLSGYGFEFASVLGEIVAAFVQNIPMPLDINAFQAVIFQY